MMAMDLARDGDRNDTKNSGKTCDNRTTACIKERRVVKPFMNYTLILDHYISSHFYTCQRQHISCFSKLTGKSRATVFLCCPASKNKHRPNFHPVVRVLTFQGCQNLLSFLCNTSRKWGDSTPPGQTKTHIAREILQQKCSMLLII